MAIVTITRHYSGFSNVADWFQVGNYEHEGNASVSDYRLPDGYRIEDRSGSIIDPAGVLCSVELHSSGLPQVISLAGPITESPVLVKL